MSEPLREYKYHHQYDYYLVTEHEVGRLSYIRAPFVIEKEEMARSLVELLNQQKTRWEQLLVLSTAFICIEE